MTPFEAVQAIASIATAIGVVIAAVQLFQANQQQRAQFESRFSTNYRNIADRLPLEALIGKPLSPETLNQSLRVFYEYFDLSNQQATLAERRSIRKETWQKWQQGILDNMARPAFVQAWEVLECDLEGRFDHLRALLKEARGVRPS